MTSSNASIHVIGRGIAGLSLAWELVRRGRPVVLVGPQERPGSATRAAVGVASVKGNLQGNSELFKAKIAAQSFLLPWIRELEAASGQRVAALQGTHEPFETLKGYEAIRERVFHRLFTGCHGVNVLDAKALTKAFHRLGSFSERVRGSFFYGGDLWVEPTELLTALEAALARAGVPVLDTLVERLVPGSEGGLVLETASGAVLAAEVAVANGVFARELLERSGLPGLPLEAVAGETLLGEAPSDVAGVLNRGKVNLALSGGRYLYGSSSRPVRSPDDAAPLRFFVEQLSSELQAFATLPPPSEVRWGLRARFKDQAPALGPLFWPASGQSVWVFLGFYKNGFQLAPLLARQLAAVIEKDGNFCLPSAFSVSRL